MSAYARPVGGSTLVQRDRTGGKEKTELLSPFEKRNTTLDFARGLLAHLAGKEWRPEDFITLLPKAVKRKHVLSKDQADLVCLEQWLSKAKDPTRRFLVELVLGLGGLRVDTRTLRRDFVNLLEQHYPALTLFGTGELLSGFIQPTDVDDGCRCKVGQLGQWYTRLRTDEELLRCGKCETLMVPTFVRLDTYVCPDDECAAHKCIYNCWNCSAIVDSDDNALCDECGWYVCRNCGCCLAGLAKGCGHRISRCTSGPGNIEEMQDRLDKYARFGSVYRENLGRFVNNPAIQWTPLGHGTLVLSSGEQLCAYMVKYGAMHFWKLVMELERVRELYIAGGPWSVIDWGCGQGVGTMVACEQGELWQGGRGRPKNVTLVEPSPQAMQTACKYLSEIYGLCPTRKLVCGFDQLNWDSLMVNDGPTLHLFSNVLDVEAYDLDRFANALSRRLSGRNLFICIGPKISSVACARCDRFAQIIRRNAKRYTEHANTKTKLFAESYDLSARKVIQRYITRYGVTFEAEM